VQLAQRRNVAALIGGDAALARSTGADGVHLLADNAAAAAYAEARRILGPSAVVGADVGISRHDAMLLGEAGADYIAFGAPPHLHDRAKGLARRNDLVAWWAEIFEMPCVAFDVESAAEARELAGLGADFVAITLTPDLSRTAVGAFVADVGAALLPSASVS
jgi:thiamine-phosphate pyrophosphorylase